MALRVWRIIEGATKAASTTVGRTKYGTMSRSPWSSFVTGRIPLTGSTCSVPAKVYIRRRASQKLGTEIPPRTPTESQWSTQVFRRCAARTPSETPITAPTVRPVPSRAAVTGSRSRRTE